MDIAKRWIDAGELMIFVLSAVAEIEREDIRTQTMAGVEQIEEWNSWLSNESIATRKSRIMTAGSGISYSIFLCL